MKVLLVAGVIGAVTGELPQWLIAGAAASGVTAWATRGTRLPALGPSGRPLRRIQALRPLHWVHSLRHPGQRIDVDRLANAWAVPVRAALAARKRYTDAVRAAPDGPLRDRLAELCDEVDVAVVHAWRLAVHGDALQGAHTQALLALRHLRGPRLGRRHRMPVWFAEPAQEQARRLHETTANRLAATMSQAAGELRLLAARLDEAAARALELTTLPRDRPAALPAPGTAAADLLNELDLLRLALADLETTPVR